MYSSVAFLSGKIGIYDRFLEAFDYRTISDPRESEGEGGGNWKDTRSAILLAFSVTFCHVEHMKDENVLKPPTLYYYFFDIHHLIFKN